LLNKINHLLKKTLHGALYIYVTSRGIIGHGFARWATKISVDDVVYENMFGLTIAPQN
jgi:hypothetical protein